MNYNFVSERGAALLTIACSQDITCAKASLAVAVVGLMGSSFASTALADDYRHLLNWLQFPILRSPASTSKHRDGQKVTSP